MRPYSPPSKRATKGLTSRSKRIRRGHHATDIRRGKRLARQEGKVARSPILHVEYVAGLSDAALARWVETEDQT